MSNAQIVQKRLEKVSKRSLLLKTFLVYLAYGLLAFSYVVPGVSLFDLRISSNSTADQISYIIPIRGLFLAVGNILCGLLSCYFSTDGIVMAFLFLISGCYYALPRVRTFAHLCASISVCGVATGALQVALSGAVFELWGKQSAPAVQVLIFFYGLGSFIAPLITRPFLLVSTATEGNHTSHLLAVKRDPQDLNVKYIYAFIASSALTIGAIFLVKAIFTRVKRESDSGKADERAVSQLSAKVKCTIVIFGILFYNFYYGLEAIAGQMLTTYLVSVLSFEVTRAALVTTTFYGFYAFIRIFGAPLIQFLGTKYTMILELGSILIGNFFILFCVKSDSAIWIGVAFLGLGVSLLNGTFLPYLNRYLTMTNKVIAVIFASGCLGEFLHPFIISLLFTSYPMIFLIVLSYCGISLSCLFFLIDFLINWKSNSSSSSETKTPTDV